MVHKPIAKFHGRVDANRVQEDGIHYEILTRAVGKLAGKPVHSTFTHTNQLLPDGSEVATLRGVVRAKKGCDYLTTLGVGAFRCNPVKHCEVQCWRGSFALVSNSPAFAELNGRAVVFEIRLEPRGEVTHRWWLLEDTYDDCDDDCDDD
ncbi:hypothetical protein GCM10027168_57570 [Streptomyces capparidis]